MRGWYRMAAARSHLLWVALFVSLFGSGLSGAAVSWFVLEHTGSTVAVGVLWVLITAPGLVVPALGGVLIDRHDRRTLHLVLDVVRGALVLAAAALVRDPALALAVVYVLLLLLGVGWAVSWPTLSALVQERSARQGLVNANAAFQISVQGGMMSAGAAVGFLYGRLGLSGILMVDAATYLASAACLGALGRGPARPEATEGQRFLADLREGASYLRSHPRVMALGAAWACMLAGILTATVLLVALARDVLKAGARGYGLLEFGWATGAVAGALLASRIVGPRTAPFLPALTLAVLAAGSALLPYVAVLTLAVGAQVVLGTSRAVGGVAIQSLLMSTVPRRLMGRVQSAFSMASTVLQVLMSLLLGWLAQSVSLGAG
ncbi:MAG TPA: MFS transporter, partial [Vicinamibacteria bacterium]|nr:MFS transporter [Vicinamibacteria bacterium]